MKRPKRIVLEILLFQTIICSIAYFAIKLWMFPALRRALTNKEEVRIVQHGFYLFWIFFMWFIGYKGLKRFRLAWPVFVWNIVNLLMVFYFLVSELLGFAIGGKAGFSYLSAMAHTALIFCTPMPLFCMLMIVLWSMNKQQATAKAPL